MPKVPLSALSALALALLLAACGNKANESEPERAVRTVLVNESSAGAVREYAAEIQARFESRLGFRVGGKIVKRFVKLGEHVKPGQPLMQIDAQDLRLAHAAANAGVTAARTNRDLAAADYKRYIDLYKQGFISAAELEHRDGAFKAAQAQLEQAKAQMDVQNNQVGYAVLSADAAGVITSVDAEEGVVVAAGMPVLGLAQDGPRDVVFAVPEDQIGGLRAIAGQPGALRMRLWGGQGELLPLSLREVAGAADPVTRTFLVKADAGKADLHLGQTATALLEMPRREQIVKLPLSAVLEERGRSSVWVLDPGSMTVKPRPVQIAGADGNEVLVAGGLKPGEEVVTAGVHVLTAGQKVRRYQPPVLPASPASAAR